MRSKVIKQGDHQAFKEQYSKNDDSISMMEIPNLVRLSTVRESKGEHELCQQW